MMASCRGRSSRSSPMSGGTIWTMWMKKFCPMYETPSDDVTNYFIDLREPEHQPVAFPFDGPSPGVPCRPRERLQVPFRAGLPRIHEASDPAERAHARRRPVPLRLRGEPHVPDQGLLCKVYISLTCIRASTKTTTRWLCRWVRPYAGTCARWSRCSGKNSGCSSSTSTHASTMRRRSRGTKTINRMRL